MFPNAKQKSASIVKLSVICITLGILLTSNLLSAEPPDDHTAQLFNGRDFDGWYVYTSETKYDNPGVFQVVDGMIYVPGGKDDIAYFGGLITKQPYENYRLRLEYKWGEKTYGTRKGNARDSGVLLHCVGPNGPGSWMTSYEYQIIEGGTGDLIVVNVGEGDDTGQKIPHTCTAKSEERDMERYFQLDGKPFTFVDRGRLNWWGRDPGWKDETGFRGREDLDSPHAEWTKCEIVARGNTLEYYVNGKLANRAYDLSTAKGRIFLQTEGAEIWYRNIQLIPLDSHNSGAIRENTNDGTR